MSEADGESRVTLRSLSSALYEGLQPTDSVEKVGLGYRVEKVGALD